MTRRRAGCGFDKCRPTSAFVPGAPRLLRPAVAVVHAAATVVVVRHVAAVAPMPGPIPVQVRTWIWVRIGARVRARIRTRARIRARIRLRAGARIRLWTRARVRIGARGRTQVPIRPVTDAHVGARVTHPDMISPCRCAECQNEQEQQGVLLHTKPPCDDTVFLAAQISP